MKLENLKVVFEKDLQIITGVKDDKEFKITRKTIEVSEFEKMKSESNSDYLSADEIMDIYKEIYVLYNIGIFDK